MTLEIDLQHALTAVIFDRDNTFVDSSATVDGYNKGRSDFVVYFDDAVDAILRIRTKHLCAIATSDRTDFSLPGLDKCFGKHYYTKHLNTSGGSFKKGVDGAEGQKCLWYIDPTTGFPRNRYEVFQETWESDVRQELDRMEKEIEILDDEYKKKRADLYEREDVVAIKKEMEDLEEAGVDFYNKRSYLGGGANVEDDDPRIVQLLEFRDFDDLAQLQAICVRMDELISAGVRVSRKVDEDLRRNQDGNTHKKHDLRRQLKEIERSEGVLDTYDRLKELESKYHDLKRGADSWLEDVDGRKFDEAWVFKNPKSIAGGNIGFGKDLGLVRRWIAGPEVDSLRTVMVGDGSEFQAIISHPGTPFILSNGGVWKQIPEVIDQILKPIGPPPDEIFDEMHATSSPVAGAWAGKSEAEWKRARRIVIPITGRIELAGRVWDITRARHIVRHRRTKEETEFITRSFQLAV